ncbi:MAG TPA: M20/M25/M40 family metallo-hydrolase [Kofleriaceae bacterium]|jgi:acetylornithine deacetylase/succinyl-diaminopimelate desuccinylase-like protein|nr:M20/M25/M40 family metallo-hydrolase [Kofleriaceae bacterium]
MMRNAGIALIAGLVVGSARPSAADTPPPAMQQLTREVFKQLVEINTTESSGDTFAAARAMGDRLLAAGFPRADVQVFQSAPRRGNLIARLRGTGKRKPLLLVAHLDVVEAKRDDWTTDPFKFVEKDGYFYGRGTSDDKDMAVAWVVNMIRWKKEGYRPDRDLVLVLETDEELGDRNGVGIQWLIKHHRDLIDAELALNEGGGVGVKEGKPFANSIQTAEKLFQNFWVEARNPGGHSSLPRKDNAIYELADALARLEHHSFPVHLNDTTRGYFEKMAAVEHGQLAQDMKSLVSPKPDPAAIDRLTAMPPYNAQIRTTCVATRLEGGHADNALPQLARAMVNCRIVPGETPEQVQKELETTFADPRLTITTVPRDPGGDPSAMNKDLLAAIEKVGPRFWPGVPAVPTMTSGATDGRFLRNAGIPTYGHSGMASDIFDVRAHGKDERVSIQATFEGEQYLYELVKALSGG